MTCLTPGQDPASALHPRAMNAARSPITRHALRETQPLRAVEAGGRAVNPSGCQALLPGRRSRAFGSARAAKEIGAGELPAQIPVLCGNFPLEQPLCF